MTKPYLYHKLQHNQLRLLKFSQEGTYLSAILESFSLEQPLPPYHALSYTWASDPISFQGPWSIEIDRRLLQVLDTLQPFVEALRAKGLLLNGQWWWIDSICINQEDLEERGQQVQLMQNIYHQAEQVIVWLGEESSDSNLAIDFLLLLDHITQQNYVVEQVRTLLQKEDYCSQWMALKTFLSRRWWSRIWTIQEFVIPSSLLFWCGLRTINRAAMCRGLQAADRCNAIGIKEVPGFSYAFNRKRAWDLFKAGERPGVHLNRPLLSLVAYFCSVDATDDRDRLYGLRALSTDGSLLDVDYTLSAQEVYLRFAKAFITRHKSLDIICFASIYHRSSGSPQPSWVPDWQKRSSTLVIPLMVSQSANTHVGNLRSSHHLDHDSSVLYSASGNKEAEYQFKGSALLARGVVIDTVDGIAGSSVCELVQTSKSSAVKASGCFHVGYAPMEILKSVCRCLVLDRKDRFLRYAMPEPEFVRDFVLLYTLLIAEPKSPAFISKEWQEWFGWTRHLKFHDQTLESILRAGIEQIKIDPIGSPPSQDEFYHRTFFGRFFDVVVRLSLRLMVTHNGCMGMVSNKAKKGDLVCVLFGCSVPVLLRESLSGDHFTFIGECFLDGYMNGLGLESTRREEKIFNML